jgi:hypothetical protein
MYNGIMTTSPKKDVGNEPELQKWIPLAAAMADFLPQVASDERIAEPAALPVTMQHAGVSFLALALAAARDERPRSAESSIANYCIAAGTPRATRGAPEVDQATIAQRLDQYAEFVKSLRSPRQLNKGEVKTAAELGAFFRQLALVCR